MFYAVKIVLLHKKLLNFLLVYQNLKRNKKMMLRFIGKTYYSWYFLDLCVLKSSQQNEGYHCFQKKQ